MIADPLRIEQALGNLLDNALRHGGQTIVLSAGIVDNAIELRVSDDGPGFPVEFIDAAFDRFTRADAARGRGGAGLGLAIVAAIAQAHGGSTSARNQADGGAQVSIRIPHTDLA